MCKFNKPEIIFYCIAPLYTNGIVFRENEVYYIVLNDSLDKMTSEKILLNQMRYIEKNIPKKYFYTF